MKSRSIWSSFDFSILIGRPLDDPKSKALDWDSWFIVVLNRVSRGFCCCFSSTVGPRIDRGSKVGSGLDAEVILGLKTWLGIPGMGFGSIGLKTGGLIR